MSDRASLTLISLQFFLSLACSLSFNLTQFDPRATEMVYQGDAAAANGAIEINCVDYRVPHPSQLSRRFPWPFQYHDGHSIVMVEFDTFPDKEWDPSTQHIGININSISSAAYAIWDASSLSGKWANVRIVYNSITKSLSVFWKYDENSSFTGETSLTHSVDLARILPEWAVVGFSAATGDSPEHHTVSSWDFISTLDNKKSDEKHHGLSRVLTIVIVLSLFLLLIVVSLTWWFARKWKDQRWAEEGRHRRGGRDINAGLYIEKGTLPRRFTYQELRAATNRFSNDRRLGQGGSGHVYKGSLSRQSSKTVVAVKRIFAQFENSEKIFINEVKIISRLVHRNLVKFIGWCHERGEFLLVYEYLPNGSLDNFLFGNKGTLDWEVRYRIVLGLVSALHYLHEDAGQCVLHRDIKAANVLLDTDFSTKLGDFGVAKLVDPLLRSQKTGVVGTLGYLAPEYLNEGRASKESDMFSFGVVALEIACGRRTYEDGEFSVSLVRWVWQLFVGGAIIQAADEKLEERFEEKEMECLLIVGLWCTNPNKRERPKAGEVIKVLKNEAPLPELPRNMHDQDFY
ncbi:hypothetical protein SAY86_021027 [Trapa natans]|uniref:Protein kinase domain-containing protein n=1 Tax=Trapa natans TaxID=22666 RepID=A0AAN7RFC6_TRANT|nr:hypothetical protein SAY86_021027 [Trapa natans]